MSVSPLLSELLYCGAEHREHCVVPHLYHANACCQGCTPPPCGCICWDESRTVRLLFHLGTTWVARQRLWSQAKEALLCVRPLLSSFRRVCWRCSGRLKTHYIFILKTFWFVSEGPSQREFLLTQGRRWPASAWLKYSSPAPPLTCLCICLCSRSQCDAVHSSVFQPPESSFSFCEVPVSRCKFPEVEGQGSGNSERLQSLVPAKSNVTGFPEPLLAFWEQEGG